MLLNEYTHKSCCLNSFNSFNSLTPEKLLLKNYS